jgi:hypothetical protein
MEEDDRMRLTTCLLGVGGTILFALTLVIGLRVAERHVLPNSVDPLLRVVPMPAGRIRPSEPGPSVPTAPGKLTLLMHVYAFSGRPIVWLRVPQQYLRGRSDHIFNNIGFMFFATYPDMKGPFAPANEGLFKCRGYCRGMMIIEVRNVSGFPLKATSEEWMSINTKCSTRPAPPAAGLSLLKRCIDERGITSRDIDYYIDSDWGRLDGYVVCWPHVPNPLCEQRVRLPHHQNVEVHYSFSMRDIGRWKNVHQAVTSLVDGFVVKTLPPEAA